VGIGKSIARTIFSGIGGTADTLGDITKTRLSKEQDLNNALARLQMGQSLEENSPMYKARVSALEDAATERARIAAERERRREISALITKGEMAETGDIREQMVSEKAGTKQALADLVNRTESLTTDDILKDRYGRFDERAMTDLIPGYGLYNSLKRSKEGVQSELGRLFGKAPSETIGAPEGMVRRKAQLESLLPRVEAREEAALEPTRAEDLASYGLSPEDIAMYGGNADTGINRELPDVYDPEVTAGLALGDPNAANKFIVAKVLELAKQGYDVEEILDMSDDDLRVRFPQLYKAKQILGK